jgi:RHS repeat-associated protein
MRPTGAVEYVLHDHLGSARITLDNAARVIESRSYTAFGDELTSSGTGARTSYIGRETDNESDLGFYGVRMYDPTYGRFLSTDPLWAKYLPLQSYQYAGNEPLLHTDRSGFVVVFEGQEFEEAHNKIYEEKDSKGNYVNGAYRARFDKLHASDVNYVVRNTKVEDSEQMSGGRAGTLSTDGQSVFIDIDASKGATFDREGTHELVHAEQFEDGYLSFGKESPGDPWKTSGNSKQLEQQAYEGQHTKHPEYGGPEWIKAVYDKLPKTSKRNIDETLSQRRVYRTPTAFQIWYPK